MEEIERVARDMASLLKTKSTRGELREKLRPETAAWIEGVRGGDGSGRDAEPVPSPERLERLERKVAAIKSITAFGEAGNKRLESIEREIGRSPEPGRLLLVLELNAIATALNSLPVQLHELFGEEI
jgi:hypothetical protein